MDPLTDSYPFYTPYQFAGADPYDEFASGYVGMGNNPVSNVDPDGGCVWCETAEKTLTLKEVVVTAVRKAPKVAEQSFSLALN